MFWGRWTFLGVFGRLFLSQKYQNLQKVNFGKIDLKSAELHELS